MTPLRLFPALLRLQAFCQPRCASPWRLERAESQALQGRALQAGFRIIPALAAGCVLVAGCAPIDQRTFNPQASMPPKVVAPVPVRHKAPSRHPFIEIMAGTPREDYATPVAKAVRMALARKPNILFIVEAAAPMQPTPARQVAALSGLTRDLATPIGEEIVKAGAEPLQLEMRAVTDPDLQQGRVRINVR
ncbi:hypothetical protein E3E11_05705 [Oecophyllibacter saccharovorans]|uniref:hypothetical protein n=1 Tax=Oecophyllibacter saccharovorans TaxID=2558360 RepID=UPI001141B773|nr:hypothetical protein [Oecophyllibacter saccharovorans]QDH15427.1 hypothetical protein E3E11_05705 [Oecophyllibacter saccharovorans]